MEQNDLISRKALLDDLEADRMKNGMRDIYLRVLGCYINCQPAVDAVEVVRCRDCKLWGGAIFGNVCRRWSAPLADVKYTTGENDFCSYGERRNDG